MAFLTTNTEGSGTLHTMSVAGGQTTLLDDVYFVGTGSAATMIMAAASTSLIIAGSLYNTSSGNAVSLTGTGDRFIRVEEDGVISSSNLSTILAAAGTALSLTNYGTIESRSGLVVNATATTSSMTILNGGVISAPFGGTAIAGGSIGDRVINTGLIYGDIDLQGGNNFFDTHLGIVAGAVRAGTGADTYIISGRELIVDGGGFDSVVSYGDYTMASGLEGLTLRGEARLGVGNAGDNRITGTSFDDVLKGRDGGDIIRGGAGDDRLLGGEGDDVLLTEGGDDFADGGAGDDIIILVDGLNQAFGGAGDDLIDSGRDANIMEGGAGVDTVSYLPSEAGVIVNLTTGVSSGGHAEGDSLRRIENLTGSDHADLLTGSSADNVLFGEAGEDQLFGMGGNDVLIGFQGGDMMNGGGGVDTVDYSMSGLEIAVNLTTGMGSGNTASGDTYVLIENVRGSQGSDTLTGSQSNNVFQGEFGEDILSGLGGEDILEGGYGSDFLTGGTGADIFLFADLDSGGGGWDDDIVTDFENGVDRISFAGVQQIDSMADLTFTPSGSNLMISSPTGDTILLSGIARAQIDASDFIFG